MTTPNAELAYKVLDQIDADPKSWDQHTWLYEKEGCGTVACFAGWAVMLAGYKPVLNEWMTFGGETTRSSRGVKFDGPILSIQDAAEQVLGIDEEDAEALFAGSNSRRQLGFLVAEIFGPRPCPNCPPGHDCERGDYATTDGVS